MPRLEGRGNVAVFTGRGRANPRGVEVAVGFLRLQRFHGITVCFFVC